MASPRAQTSPPVIADTIPVRARKDFRIDQVRYRNYLATSLNDSVKLKKADAKDWSDYNAALAKLQTTLQQNPFNNVQDYIDGKNDFKSLQLIEQGKVPNTAKICLRQLIFNLNTATTLLGSPMSADVEPKLLSSVIRNIDTLALSYIVPYVTRALSMMRYPKIVFQVVDKNNVEVKNVNCLLVTPKVCRDISCKSCKATMPPCQELTFAKMVEQRDYSFDCMNPKVLDVAPGVYHVFVVSGNKIIGYQWASFDAGDLMAGTTPKTVKIALQ